MSSKGKKKEFEDLIRYAAYAAAEVAGLNPDEVAENTVNDFREWLERDTRSVEDARYRYVQVAVGDMVELVGSDWVWYENNGYDISAGSVVEVTGFDSDGDILIQTTIEGKGVEVYVSSGNANRGFRLVEEEDDD